MKKINKSEIVKLLKEAIGDVESGTKFSMDDDNLSNGTFDKLKNKLSPGDEVEITNESEEDEDTSELNSLYSDTDTNSVEYGIKYETFDELMESLKNGGSPTIKLTENINPRIKKSDLINYFKNKK